MVKQRSNQGPSCVRHCQRMSGWEPLGHFASSVKGKPPSTTPTEVILHGTHNVHHCSNYQMMRFTTSFNHTQHMGRLFQKCLYYFLFKSVFVFYQKHFFLAWKAHKKYKSNVTWKLMIARSKYQCYSSQWGRGWVLLQISALMIQYCTSLYTPGVESKWERPTRRTYTMYTWNTW